ncbi:arginine/lysine/ornithine decarboxylases [Pelotomaculum thermopropionicum SI]|uniref:Arginine/lysine/ornithine decarboxylases n=1 Tax=Pelotomaculum thermopropionicum (strain DSM 13744 / JCM 10971 / SI) TaxID=370438 RepID=A5D689_PELTS|nr:arginine/lysine/ornithine decarboxylases [Pelotomaculum thermopropionicum SI]
MKNKSLANTAFYGILFLLTFNISEVMLLGPEQERAPLFEALAAHVRKNPAGLHVPGHSRGRGLPEELLSLGSALFGLDLTELPGLDDLHSPRGPIARAQELAAQAYGADRTFFLVNGTTAGIHALICAAGRGKIIVPRNAHRSVLGGLILSDADPVYVVPGIIPGFGVDCGITPREAAGALDEYPGAALLVVRPNYYGVAEDLDGLVLAAHMRDRPLMVDEAHGAHLRFHPGLPEDAMAAGADASVQSTHKLGGSLTQSSMLHLRGGRLDAEKVAASLSLLQTTSPSYILMVSLDLARRQLALMGEGLIERVLELARELRGRLARIRGLEVLTGEHLPGNAARLDPTRLVISVRGLGLTGYQAAGLLAERYGVFVEMADYGNLVAVISAGTARADCNALAHALEDLAARERPGRRLPALPLPAGFRKVMKPREAWFSPAQRVALEDAKGRVCAEMVAVYPPGIPAVCPGEVITPEVHEYLVLLSKMRVPCQGASDPELKTIKVVVE